jgi:hypothetical protein
VGYIPVLLRSEESLQYQPWCDYFAPMKTDSRADLFPASDEIDPFVNGTNGAMYRPLVGRLLRYPIRELRVPPGQGQSLLDIGCNWARWSISAARKGYAVVGLGPCLQAVEAARRVSQQLDLKNDNVVGDATHLLFSAESFDVVFLLRSAASGEVGCAKVSEQHRADTQTIWGLYRSVAECIRSEEPTESIALGV